MNAHEQPMGTLTPQHTLPKGVKGPWRVITKAEHAALPLKRVVPRLWLSAKGCCLPSTGVTPPGAWSDDSGDIYITNTRPGHFLPKHNPAGIDNAEADGYRLVTEAEFKRIFVPGAQWWNIENNAWLSRTYEGVSGASVNAYETVRVPHPHGADLTKPAEVTGHNPDELTPARVEVAYGYRLLSLEEIKGRVTTETGDTGIEIWAPYGRRWQSRATGNVASFSYRTLKPPGYYLPRITDTTPPAGKPLVDPGERLDRITRILEQLNEGMYDGVSLGRVGDALNKIAQSVESDVRFKFCLTSF